MNNEAQLTENISSLIIWGAIALVFLLGLIAIAKTRADPPSNKGNLQAPEIDVSSQPIDGTEADPIIWGDCLINVKKRIEPEIVMMPISREAIRDEVFRQGIESAFDSVNRPKASGNDYDPNKDQYIGRI
jgi:hypothetical protein